MKYAIEIKNLIKEYHNFELKNINLKIPSGMVIGLIGENGAGKTTLIKSILNIIKTKSGSIQIFDKDYIKKEAEIKEDIGVVLDDMFFPELLTIKDINSIMKDIYTKWDSDLFSQYLERFDLPENKHIKELSKGMHKKLEIATALAHRPKLLILDEPTSGLDPVIRSEVLDVFLEFLKDEDHTILFSTHITTDLEHIADYIIFLNHGEVLLDMPKDEILDSYGILKCDEEQFKKIDKKDIIRYKKNKYSYEILIENKEKMIHKYPNYVIDKVTLEDMMILYIRGEKK